jgi:hypothetical protein
MKTRLGGELLHLERVAQPGARPTSLPKLQCNSLEMLMRGNISFCRVAVHAYMLDFVMIS